MNKPTVFYIIDDDTDDQNFLIEALKELYPLIECFTAFNGQEGLKKLNSNDFPNPSLIFLDLNMPKISGRQFLYEIKNHPRLKHIPIIIYTTSSHQKDMDDLKKLGASDYLVKATDHMTLMEKLNTILPVVLSSKF